MKVNTPVLRWILMALWSTNSLTEPLSLWYFCCYCWFGGWSFRDFNHCYTNVLNVNANIPSKHGHHFYITYEMLCKTLAHYKITGPSQWVPNWKMKERHTSGQIRQIDQHKTIITTVYEWMRFFMFAHISI